MPTTHIHNQKIVPTGNTTCQWVRIIVSNADGARFLCGPIFLVVMLMSVWLKELISSTCSVVTITNTWNIIVLEDETTTTFTC